MKSHTQAADELAKKIALVITNEYQDTPTSEDVYRVQNEFRKHTGITLAELLADKERLDWLDVNSRMITNTKRYNFPLYLEGDNLRLAIDAAMNATHPA